MPENKAIRLRFAKEYLKYGNEFWQSVVFSDESLIGHSKGRQYARLCKGHRAVYQYAKQINPEGFRIMVWAAICSDGTRSIKLIDEKVTGKVYKAVLEEKLGDFPGLRRGVLLLQQDNAPAHRSKAVKNYLVSQGIDFVSWPAQSPDLNIMENVWAFVKRGLRDHYPSKEALKRDILRVWETVEDNYIFFTISKYDKQTPCCC